MRYQDCIIVWTPPADAPPIRARSGISSRIDPTAGRVEVLDFPDRTGRARAYMKDVGASFAGTSALTPEQVTAQVYIHFAQLVREERLDVDRVHRAFMEIDEYRNLYCAEPMMGEARIDDRDTRIEWEGLDIALAEQPTWDEAVLEITRAIDTVRPTDSQAADKLQAALMDAVIADAQAGRWPKVAVQALRLGINFAGALSADRALTATLSAADALQGAR